MVKLMIEEENLSNESNESNELNGNSLEVT